MSKGMHKRIAEDHTKHGVLWYAILFFTIVLGTKFVYSVVVVPTLQGNTYVDFQCYYAASFALLKGENFYKWDLPTYYNIFNGKIVFLYPPVAALLFIPLSLIPYKISAFLWLILNLTLVVIIINFLAKLKPLGNRRISFLILLLLIFLFWPLEVHLGGGQTCLLILALLLWCYRSIQKGKFVLAGAIIAMAIHIRLMPGIFLIYFLIKRKWRLSAWTLVWGMLFGVIGFIVVGYEIHVYYLTKTVSWLVGAHDWGSNQAFSGFMYQLCNAGLPMSKETVLSLARIIGGVVLLGTFIYMALRKKDFKKTILEEFAFLLLVTLFIGGYSAEYYYVFCFLPLWIFRPDEKHNSWKPIEFVFFAIAFTLMAFPLGYDNPILRDGILSLWIPTKFYGLVILMYLALRKMAKEENREKTDMEGSITEH